MVCGRGVRPVMIAGAVIGQWFCPRSRNLSHTKNPAKTAKPAPAITIIPSLGPSPSASAPMASTPAGLQPMQVVTRPSTHHRLPIERKAEA